MSVGKEVSRKRNNRKKSHWEYMSLGKYINGKNCPRKISLGKRCQQENIAINENIYIPILRKLTDSKQ